MYCIQIMTKKTEHDKSAYYKELAEDVAMEICYGSDRFTVEDLRTVANEHNLSLQRLRDETEQLVRTKYAKQLWDDAFLNHQLSVWFE